MTAVLEQSALGRRVDPRSFFMLLNANFDALVRGGGLDLGPLWGSLATDHGKDPALPGLFLGFEFEAQRHGLEAQLPPNVESLDRRARRDALTAAFEDDRWAAIADVPASGAGAIPVADLAVEAGQDQEAETASLPELGPDDLRPVEDETPGLEAAAPVEVLPELGSQDLQPIGAEGPGPAVVPARPEAEPPGASGRPGRRSAEVGPQRRRDLVNALVKAVRESPDGHLIDGAQLGYQVDAHFEKLCDGERMDVTPMVDSLRGVEDFSERSIYAALVGAHRALDEQGMELVAPPLQLSEAEMAEVVAEVRARARDRARIDARAPSSEPAAPPGQAASRAASPGRSSKEERLRRYHLLGMDPKRARWIRRTLLVVTLLSLGAFAWFGRPDRPLDPSPYPVPLASAKLEGGRFAGRLNDKAWYRQPPERRRPMLESMEEALRNDGFIAGAVITDRHGRVVAQAIGTQLRGSRWMLESPDGERPPPRGQPIDPKTGEPVEPESDEDEPEAE